MAKKGDNQHYCKKNQVFGCALGMYLHAYCGGGEAFIPSCNCTRYDSLPPQGVAARTPLSIKASPLEGRQVSYSAEGGKLSFLKPEG
jgi:hypothetical protein